MAFNLSIREEQILRDVVTLFVEKGKPVGSKTLRSLGEKGLSSATIRNVMVQLKKKGFIRQPHTSAGRIPTAKAYRYYIDNLFQPKTLEPALKYELGSAITNILRYRRNDLTYKSLSKVLARVSMHVGLVIIKRAKKRNPISALLDNFSQYAFIYGNKVNEYRFIHSLDGWLYIKNDFISNKLGNSTFTIKDGVKGANLDIALQRKMLELSEDLSLDTFIVEHEFGSVDECIDVYWEGTTNLANKPEFSTADGLRQIVYMFEQKDSFGESLIKLAEKIEKDNIVIFSSSDMGLTSNLEFAMIFSKYRKSEKDFGLLGILGPTRMDYGSLIPFVGYASQLFQSYMHC